MQIAPRYDGQPVVTLTGHPDVAEGFFRQRRRLLASLALLSDDDWREPSRCDGWSVQDVATHLTTVNGFWRWSITAGLAGSPTRLLAGFDPKATPAALVDAAGSTPPSAALAALVESDEALCEVVGSLDDQGWSALAEAPPGHLPIDLVVHHALWDCWVHERDIALPLGLAVAEEPDEVMACLRYVAALGPAFALTSGATLASGEPVAGVLVLETTEPDGCVVVEVSDHVAVHDRPVAAAPAATEAPVVLRDKAVNLVEALSARAPLAHPVRPADRWLVDSLGQVFETV
jgi:uncharacterized protein (TIGR03083 family)